MNWIGITSQESGDFVTVNYEIQGNSRFPESNEDIPVFLDGPITSERAVYNVKEHRNSSSSFFATISWPRRGRL